MPSDFARISAAVRRPGCAVHPASRPAWRVAALGLLALATAARGDVVSLSPSKDNTLYQSAAGDLSNGAGSYFFAGTTAQESIRRGLIAFDVAAAVPAGSTILSAALRLHMSRTAAAAEPVSVHRVLRDWGEGASIAFGEEGGGGPATPGDATWLHTFYADAFWTQTGGDFAESASATLLVVGPDFYTWSSPGMNADVQAWLDNPAGNAGWLLRSTEDVFPTSKRFATREHPEPEKRPSLVIEYSIPEPGGLLGALATLAIAVRRIAR